MNNNNKTTKINGITTADLAATLGKGERAVRKCCEKLGIEPIWRARPGGNVYDLNTLPAEWRIALAAQLASEDVKSFHAGAAEGAAGTIVERVAGAAGAQARARGLMRLSAMPLRARDRVEIKVAVVILFERYHAARGGALNTARSAFARAWNAGEIAADSELRGRVKSLSASSLNRWAALAVKKGAEALAGRYGNRKGCSRIDTQRELSAWITGFISEYPHAQPKKIMHSMRAAFRGQQIEQIDVASGEIKKTDVRFPSLRALQRWIQKYRREQHAVLAKNANPDAFRSKYQAAFGSRSEGIERLNQLWETDASPVDLITTDGRCAVIGVIDVYSRRVKLFISKTSTAIAVGLAVRRCFLDWGMPEVLKSDNGTDFVSKHVTIACAALGVGRELCDPYAPEQKPHIERALGTFLHDIVELCAGYIGHTVADRKAIEARKSFAQRRDGAKSIEIRLSAARLQEICDQWCEAVYGRREHRGLNGRSPFEVATAWIEPVRRIENERALDVLLAPMPEGRTRVVGKKGIRVGGFSYGAAELGACINERVIPLHDPDGDAGRLIVYTETGDFICIAECPEITGVSRAEIAAKMTAHQKAFIAERTAPIKAAAKQFKNVDIAKLILDDAVAQAANVVALPRATVSHETPALGEAARAAARLDGRALAGTASAAELASARARLAAAAPRTVARLPETARQRYQRWVALDEAARAGAVLSESDQGFHTGFQQTPEFRAFRHMEQHMGGTDIQEGIA